MSRKSQTELINVDVVVNNQVFQAKLYNTKTTQVLLEQMPMTISMDELNGNEKCEYLSYHLPMQSAVPPRIHSGDIKLFGSNCIVLFYKSFSTSYSYTDIGYLENVDNLEKIVGRGSVEVTFRK